VFDHVATRLTPEFGLVNPVAINALNGMDLNKAILEYRHLRMPVMKYLEGWANSIWRKEKPRIDKLSLKEGDNYVRYRVSDNFGADLRINGYTVQSIEMEIAFVIKIQYPKIISHYDFATRGRTMKFAGFSLGNLIIEDMNMTAIYEPTK
jgi:hypothetical protein